MDMHVKVTIEGLEQLTEAMTMLASAIAYGKGYEGKGIEHKEPPQTEAPKPEGKEAKQDKKQKAEKRPEPPQEKTPDPEITESPDQSVPHEAEVAPAVDLAAVRTKLSAISKVGKAEQVKTLMATFGVDKLTDLDPAHYAEILEKAEAL